MWLRRMNTFHTNVHETISIGTFRAAVELEQEKSLRDTSCMTKHFVKIVQRLAFAAAGSSICGIY